MRTIQNQTFDEERALYGSNDILVKDCSFDGPADGESAFKECKNVEVAHGFFNLRYPFWHDHNLTIRDSEMTEHCRAALWYSDHISIGNTKASWHQSPAGVRRCNNDRMRCKFPGIWLVRPQYGNERLHRRERIFYDAFYRPTLYKCTE